MPRRERRSFTPEFRARTVELIESGARSDQRVVVAWTAINEPKVA